MKTLNLFTSETITAGASIETDAIDLAAYMVEGFASIQLAVSGSGTITVEYKVSNNKVTYITQSATADIITSGFTATSGPGSDGKDLISIEFEPAQRAKIKITETGGADSVVVSADLRLV